MTLYERFCKPYSKERWIVNNLAGFVAYVLTGSVLLALLIYFGVMTATGTLAHNHRKNEA